MSRLIPRRFNDFPSLRQSLINHLSAVQVPGTDDKLLDHGRRLTASILKSTGKAYGLEHPDPTSRVPRMWSVATGTYEPSVTLLAAHMVPAALGTSICRRVFADHRNKHLDFWGPRNSLVLPVGLGLALEDWAVTLVPVNKSDGLDVSGLEMRVLDPSHEGLQASVTIDGFHTMKRWMDMDGLRLVFPDDVLMRPAVEYLYFRHRCAVQKHEEPDAEDLTAFWAALLQEVQHPRRHAESLCRGWRMPRHVASQVPVADIPYRTEKKFRQHEIAALRLRFGLPDLPPLRNQPQQLED